MTTYLFLLEKTRLLSIADEFLRPVLKLKNKHFSEDLKLIFKQFFYSDSDGVPQGSMFGLALLNKVSIARLANNKY